MHQLSTMFIAIFFCSNFFLLLESFIYLWIIRNAMAWNVHHFLHFYAIKSYRSSKILLSTFYLWQQQQQRQRQQMTKYSLFIQLIFWWQSGRWGFFRYLIFNNNYMDSRETSNIWRGMRKRINIEIKSYPNRLTMIWLINKLEKEFF